MAKKQYLDLAGLTIYDEEIKAHIDEVASGKADSSHNHAASNITSGTLSSDRLPTVPIAKGGTGATTAAGALTNLGITATAAELNKMDGVTATTTELNYVDGVTSNIQSQLDSKASLSDHKIITYTDLSQIGLTLGSETIESIANALPVGSVLQIWTGLNHNTDIYPTSYGSLRVEKYHNVRTCFTFHNQSAEAYREWIGFDNGSHWSDWDEVLVASKAVTKEDCEWTQIYDSGSITSRVNSISNINISGYKKFKVVVKCVNNTNSAARAGSAIFKATDGTSYQFPVWTNLFTTSASTSAGMAEFEIIDGYLVCSNATRSIKTTSFLSSSEGGTADNLVATGSGIIKCSKTLSGLVVSSLDQDSNFYFEAGSKVIVWGCMA